MKEPPPLQTPGSLALMTLMAGPHISGFPAFTALSRLSAPIWLRTGVILAGIAFPLLYLILLFWKIKWYWTSLIVIGAHLGCAVLTYFLFRRLRLINKSSYHTGIPASERQEKKYILAGMAGGASLVPVLGAPLTILFLLASDNLLFTLMPMAFDDIASLYLLVIAIFGLFMAGLIAGGWAGGLSLRLTPTRTFLGICTLIWISLSWFICLILIIMLPSFLSAQVDRSIMWSSGTVFVVATLFIGCWWTAYLLIYTFRRISTTGRIIRALCAPLICLSTVFIFGLACGYPSNWFFSAGKYLEKNGRIASAIWCYENGLGKKPTGHRASYLQYRIAIAEHKRGNTEKAVRGFRKIVSMHNYNKRLVTKAYQFLDNIERNRANPHRVVLPGVDNPTTYKGAYCVPNSLALVLNFWGANLGADDIGQQITSMAAGTMTVDQTWFALQNGFRHEFVPMATISDIKSMIDAGFPVMVYVPSHVFVIVGYDDQLETLVTYDVATGDVWVEYLEKDFIKSWKKENSTMVVAYPADRQDEIPANIVSLIKERSDSYFQYHLHQLQSISGEVYPRHLEAAASDQTTFFFPVTDLFKHYPSSRTAILAHENMQAIVASICSFYGRDFDEGVHLAGQYHDSSSPDKDEDLNQSIEFLIGAGKTGAAKALIETIESMGIISEDTSELLSMINLSTSDIPPAITLLEKQNNSQLHFYLALAHLKQGHTKSAVPELVEAIDGCT